MTEKSPEELKKDLDQFKQWIQSQPHLPQDLEEKLLVRFLHSCYYNLEDTKKAFELFFTIRGSWPELLNDRDPLSPQMQKVFKYVNLAQLQISENRNLWIWQLNDPGLDNYDYVQDARMFLLSTDAWLLHETHLEEQDIVIMDVKDISLKFITKFNVSVARKLSKYQEEAMPLRLKQVHVVNAPPFIDRIYSVLKPFMKQEMTNKIHFHTPKSETLYKFVSKEDLPEDYGGTLPKMDEHMKEVVRIVMSKRKFLLDNTLWRAIDKKKNKGENAAVVSSFRTLAID